MQGVMYCTCGNICPTEVKLASVNLEKPKDRRWRQLANHMPGLESEFLLTCTVRRSTPNAGAEDLNVLGYSPLAWREVACPSHSPRQQCEIYLDPA